MTAKRLFLLLFAATLLTTASACHGRHCRDNGTSYRETERDCPR